MRVFFSPLAAHDMEEIGDYIFKDNPQAARKITRELRAKCHGLSKYPLRGVSRPDIEPASDQFRSETT